MARICATIANSSGFREGPPTQEKDFLPNFDRNAEPEWQPLDQMKAVAKRAAALNRGGQTGGIGDD